MLPTDLSTQRVLIFGTSILEEGIAHLLTSGVNLQVSCARYTNELEFLDEVIQKQPNVILLNDAVPLNKTHIFKLLFSFPSLTGLRIIVTRLTSNIIDVYMMPDRSVTKMVYERQQIIAPKREELVAFIRG